jgi:hypothetical protein
VNGNGHADLVVSIHSRWVGVIDKSQGLVELANVREYVLEARIDSRGGPLFICSLSNRSSRRSKNLEIQENFILEIFQSLVCTNGRIVRRTEPCKRSAFTLFRQPRNALAHIVALVVIQRIEMSDSVKMKLFLMCLLYVEEIFFTRQKARKDIQKPCLLDFYFFI